MNPKIHAMIEAMAREGWSDTLVGLDVGDVVCVGSGCLSVAFGDAPYHIRLALVLKRLKRDLGKSSSRKLVEYIKPCRNYPRMSHRMRAREMML